MKSLLEKMMALKEELPTGYWIYDKVKGARRVTLARLVGVYKSSLFAAELTDVLKALDLSKGIVDSKMKDLEESIAAKESVVPGITAAIRETEDFLNETEEYSLIGNQQSFDSDDECWINT